MRKLPLPCPNCGGTDTVCEHGPDGLSPDCFQQRHKCRECGQKWVAFWDFGGNRMYGRPEGPKKPDTRQMSLKMEF